MTEIIESDWNWTRSFNGYVTPDGEEFTPEMDNAAIVGEIDATTCSVYRLIRRTGESSIEVEEFVSSGSAVVRYHDGPYEVDAAPDDTYVDLIGDGFLENAEQVVADAEAAIE